MKKNNYIFLIWIAVSALLIFGLAAMERSGCATRSVDEEKHENDPGENLREKDQNKHRDKDDKSSREDKGSRAKKADKEKGSHGDGEAKDKGSGADGLPTVVSIAAAVSELRGLPLKSDIKVSYLNQEELRDQIESEFEEEYPAEEAEAEEKALKALDLIGPQVDLRAAMQGLLVDQVIGYYDDDTKELALISDHEELDTMNEVTLAHEVTHAIQDQSFGLSDFYPLEGPATGDANFARLALVEGDASLAMTEYVETELSALELLGLGMSASGSSGGLAGTPPYLDDSLMFPYVAGEGFVTYAWEEGGWELVNAIYAAPPESTEQIIHPEKYFEGDHPVQLTIPDLLPVAGPGWEMVYDESFGEFDVRQLLGGGMSNREASAAADGWGGGRYDYYERSDGGQMAVILLTWDDEDEADEFTYAMADYLGSTYCSDFEFEERQFPILESCDGDYWVMVKKGTAVLVARVPDKTLANMLPVTVLGARPQQPVEADHLEPGSVLTNIEAASLIR